MRLLKEHDNCVFVGGLVHIYFINKLLRSRNLEVDIKLYDLPRMSIDQNITWLVPTLLRDRSRMNYRFFASS